MGNTHTTVRRVLLLSLGVSILTSTGIAPACAISMPGMSKKSASSFDLPTAEKLEGDTADDAQANPELAPMSLTETRSSEPAATTTATPAPQGSLNANVTENAFIPKGPLEGDGNNNSLLAPMSVKGSKSQDVGKLGGSLLEQANSINAAPLPLIESAADSERRADEKQEVEREQLTTLWEATLSRSPDINFVLQKLLPTTDPSKVTTVLMRTLAQVASVGVGTIGMVSPTPGGYAMQNVGFSTMQQILNMTDSKAAKKAKITQTEQIILYNMIRDTADKLVLSYRNYKAKHQSLFKANSDFDELKNLAAEAKKDGSKEVEIDYTLRKQQRDIEELGSQLGTLRQMLSDMAGAEAVAKLDGSIDDEFKKLHPELAPATDPERVPDTIAKDDQSSSSPQPAANESAPILATPPELKQPTAAIAGTTGNHFKVGPL